MKFEGDVCEVLFCAATFRVQGLKTNLIYLSTTLNWRNVCIRSARVLDVMELSL